MPSKITPFEERLTPGSPVNAEAREQAMLAELAEWRALAESRTKADTLTRGDDANYNTGHADLDLLLGLTEDMALGHGNMDTGMLWMTVLERLQVSLGVPSAEPLEVSSVGAGAPP